MIVCFSVKPEGVNTGKGKAEDWSSDHVPERPCLAAFPRKPMRCGTFGYRDALIPVAERGTAYSQHDHQRAGWRGAKSVGGFRGLLGGV